jgi:deazaflavin-dependent oxidoreductase (nitroreductase family)
METKELSQFAHEEFCYLTTTGRKTSKPHEIEIWFCIHDNSLYLMAGGGEKADWVQNLIQNPVATIRIGKEIFSVTARFDKDKSEDEAVRNLMADKYQEREKDGSLSEWAQTALPVAFDVFSETHL